MDDGTSPPDRPYAIPRHQIEANLENWSKAGAIPNPEALGAEIQTLLAKNGFKLDPKNDWGKIGYEVIITELAIGGRVSEREIGNAELAKECKALAERITKINYRVANLSSHKAISIAQLSLQIRTVGNSSALFKIAAELRDIADFLENTKQRNKWKSTEMRRARLELACQLVPIFENEFSMPAKPVGGSEKVDLEFTNDWTIFFQVISNLILNETGNTPDRQAILWEAAKLSGM